MSQGNGASNEGVGSSVGSGGQLPLGAQAIPAAPAPVKFTTLSKEYIHLGGTKFTGTESIVKAQQWLKKMERIFTGLEITDAQKRQLASWQLQGAASNWWESVTSRMDDNTITLA